MPYTADTPVPPPTSESLRARIPGWGADLDHADRPAFPRESFDLPPSGAHWAKPSPMDPAGYRERSIEHLELPPVFGTAQPLHGVSGAIRRFAYERFSEGRSVHWLLLILGDRVDATGAHLRSLATLRPDDPVTETGVLSEARRHPIASRRGRSDVRHQALDPLIVAGPWVLSAIGVVLGGRALLRRLR
ncbi:hypothetical protein SAMN06295885_0003 [Rathayibacter oskolensis]|uniref:Uncharacterized protein n=1 Tax=Rathayibacter oskolensis TaxID=1891671 RepID=A0A1X7MSC4_9MICO|nr:hypothetical protein [Rathayibacter oskolensis]SMH27605.1 hypothetical protein SAMN06295885_0003 [Rathayibacter oskolensis]